MNWRVLALRGIAAEVFGAFGLLVPEVELTELVLVFGVYALVDGVCNVVVAVLAPGGYRRWWTLAAEGLASIAAAIITFLWPTMTDLWLLLLIAGWAVATGALEIAAAMRLRRLIVGERFLLASGIASALFGVLLFFWQEKGAIALVWWIGTYAILVGCMLLGLAARLRSLGDVPDDEAVGVV
jgi:uncharacterized membrane protein HdeD (DUF308 family)